jgi:hypothetical protein
MLTSGDLIGTWRVTAFREWRKDGTQFRPLGDAPVGYAVFDAGGRVFIQLGKNPADCASAKEAAESFMAYFGTFKVAGETLSLAIESGNERYDIATSQTRTITLDGDVLSIGIPGRFMATLRRA